MTREEEKYQAANNAWNIRGLTNQEQKISYKLGFLEGFDYADQHPREGLWDVEKVEKVLGNLLFNKETKNEELSKTNIELKNQIQLDNLSLNEKNNKKTKKKKNGKKEEGKKQGSEIEKFDIQKKNKKKKKEKKNHK